jgi:GDP-L-fucose synthase
MKILLTGGSGFIGKNILKSSLAVEYEIIAPGSRELDLTDKNAVDAFFLNNKIDYVIHAACKPGHRNAKDPSNIFYTDMLMFLNLFDNSERYKKMIVLSSGAVYDQRFEIVKAKEDDYSKHLPTDEHALFRRVSADYIAQSDKVMELRIFGIFGPHEDYAIRFISNAICKALFDLPITIKQNRKFDYIYVNDLIEVIDYFLKNTAKHKSYNVTSDKSIELLSLAEEIKKISGKELSIIVKDIGLGLEYSGDNSRLHQEIRNLKFTTEIQTIQWLYNWYSEHKQDINRELLLIDK